MRRLSRQILSVLFCFFSCLVLCEASEGTKVEGQIENLARLKTKDGRPMLFPLQADRDPIALPARFHNLLDATEGLVVRLPHGTEAVPVSDLDITSQLIVDWSERPDQLKTGLYQPIEAAFSSYKSSFDRAVTTEVDLREVHRDLDSVRDSLARTLAQGVTAAEEASLRSLLTTAEIERYGFAPRCVPRGGISTADKALYGEDDRFPPQTYEQVWKASKSTAAIFKKNNWNKALGSAVLVGKDLVLTCRHVTKRHGVETKKEMLTVVFGYEVILAEDPQSGIPTPQPTNRKAFKIKEYVLHGEKKDGYDFTLMRLEPLNGKHAGEFFPPLTLYGQDVEPGERIYVIGHPDGQPRTVADNARVVFPHRIHELTFQQLLNRLLSQYAPTVAAGEDGWSQQLSRRDDIAADFNQSYRQIGETGYRENYGPGTTEVRSIGADCDTFKGNSGGPAFLKSNHKVIGLLFSGERDYDQSGNVLTYDVGWERHERIIPIGAIVDRIKEKLPDDWAQLGLEIE